MKYLEVCLIPTFPAVLMELVKLFIMSKYSNSNFLDLWLEKALIKRSYSLS